MKKYKNEIISLKESIENRFVDIERKLKTIENKESSPQLNSTVRKIVDECMPIQPAESDEHKLIEKKKLNLIYFGIPESTSTENAERIQHDYRCLQKNLWS